LEVEVATETIQAADHELLIAGDRVETGDWSEVHSPYDGTIVGRVAKADADVVDRAISVAGDAFAAGGFPQHERAAVLERAAELVADREDELALASAAEAGKPLKTARVEAQR
jgi:acyl-CoA reductase-like NAD-dependent aldehyde dehydrogenase